MTTGRLIPVAAAAAALALTGSPTAHGAASARGDPGRLPQTHALPSARTPQFRARMAALWRGIVHDSPAAARPAFFPRSAYLQVKQIANPAADFRDRLLAGFRADIHAAHALLGAGAAGARLVSVRVPTEWAWIEPGDCYNRIGYWHAPGSRLVYREHGRIRSFGLYSLISWRGQWYVVHLSEYDEPGTVYEPAGGVGAFGPPGGC